MDSSIENCPEPLAANGTSADPSPLTFGTRHHRDHLQFIWTGANRLGKGPSLAFD